MAFLWIDAQIVGANASASLLDVAFESSVDFVIQIGTASQTQAGGSRAGGQELKFYDWSRAFIPYFGEELLFLAAGEYVLDMTALAGITEPIFISLAPVVVPEPSGLILLGIGLGLLANRKSKD